MLSFCDVQSVKTIECIESIQLSRCFSFFKTSATYFSKIRICSGLRLFLRSLLSESSITRIEMNEE